MLGSREEIHSSDPSQLILSRNNELGFLRIAPPKSRSLAYIAPRMHNSPWIKPTLINDDY
jgi:hypothetical protein